MPEVSAGDQVPPVSGEPPRLRKRSTGLSEEHKSRVASIPALGGVVIVTMTSAVSSGQGLVPETV